MQDVDEGAPLGPTPVEESGRKQDWGGQALPCRSTRNLDWPHRELGSWQVPSDSPSISQPFIPPPGSLVGRGLLVKECDLE